MFRSALAYRCSFAILARAPYVSFRGSLLHVASDRSEVSEEQKVHLQARSCGHGVSVLLVRLASPDCPEASSGIRHARPCASDHSSDFVERAELPFLW